MIPLTAMRTENNLNLKVSIGYEKGVRGGTFEGWVANSGTITSIIKETDVEIANKFVLEYWELLEKYGFSNHSSSGGHDGSAPIQGPDFSLRLD